MNRNPLMLLLLLFVATANGRETLPPDGIWNIGSAGHIRPLRPSDSIRCQRIRLDNQIVLVNLYPGFAVVKSEYRFSNPSDSAIRIDLAYPASGHYPLQGLGKGIFDDNRGLRVVSNGAGMLTRRVTDSIHGPMDAYDPWIPTASDTWSQTFAPRSTTNIVVYLIARTHLSRLLQDGEESTGNAFGYITEGNKHWQGGPGSFQMLVKLNGELYLTDMRGLLPDSAFTANLTHLQYGFSNREASKNGNIAIWYRGAAANYTFDKKVLPAMDTLFHMMDEFPMAEFDDPSFRPVSKSDFSVAPTGLTFATVLYFLMFSLPWLILGAVIIYLIRGRGKKKQEPLSEEDPIDL